jgi:hypothetical protein
MSLINTAICARFAASATKLKSRRKGDAESMGICRCGGGCCGCCVVLGAEVGPLDCADEEVETAKCECWFFEGPFRDGDDNGASIAAGSKCVSYYRGGWKGGLDRASLALIKRTERVRDKGTLSISDGDNDND